MSIVQAVNISKDYGHLQVLKNVNVTIEQGEIVTIVGKSGAGKSTLLHILGTLDVPDSGELTLCGQRTKDLSAPQLAELRNESIGFVFQFHHLLGEFTALENVCIPALIKGISNTHAKKRARELLDYLGLHARMQHKPTKLSGGEQQRVAIARALMNSPALILADEPTGNLDSENSAEMHQLFVRLRDDLNQTFVIVTHNNDLAKLSDRNLHMVDGTLDQNSS